MTCRVINIITYFWFSGAWGKSSSKSCYIYVLYWSTVLEIFAIITRVSQNFRNSLKYLKCLTLHVIHNFSDFHEKRKNWMSCRSRKWFRDLLYYTMIDCCANSLLAVNFNLSTRFKPRNFNFFSVVLINYNSCINYFLFASYALFYLLQWFHHFAIFIMYVYQCHLRVTQVSLLVKSGMDFWTWFTDALDLRNLWLVCYHLRFSWVDIGGGGGRGQSSPKEQKREGGIKMCCKSTAKEGSIITISYR